MAIFWSQFRSSGFSLFPFSTPEPAYEVGPAAVNVDKSG